MKTAAVLYVTVVLLLCALVAGTLNNRLGHDRVFQTNPVTTTSTPTAPTTTTTLRYVARCETDPTSGWARCFDQNGLRIDEGDPLWDCSTMGNFICGPVK
jgi:hypothetical protein